MTEALRLTIVRVHNRYPEKNDYHWADKYDITEEEVRRVIDEDKQLEKDIVTLFKTISNNSATNIAKLLNTSSSKVNVVVNKHLEGCEIG